MKKTAGIILVLFFILLISASACAESQQDLVNITQDTESFTYVSENGGTAVYDNENHILTLTDYTFEGTRGCFGSTIPMTIAVKGTNSLSATSGDALDNIKGDLTITGESRSDTLTVRGMNLFDSSVSVKNVTFSINAYIINYALRFDNGGAINVDNAQVEINRNETAGTGTRKYRAQTAVHHYSTQKTLGLTIKNDASLTVIGKDTSSKGFQTMGGGISLNITNNSQMTIDGAGTDFYGSSTYLPMFEITTDESSSFTGRARRYAFDCGSATLDGNIKLGFGATNMSSPVLTDNSNYQYTINGGMVSIVGDVTGFSNINRADGTTMRYIQGNQGYYTRFNYPEYAITTEQCTAYDREYNTWSGRTPQIITTMLENQRVYIVADDRRAENYGFVDWTIIPEDETINVYPSNQYAQSTFFDMFDPCPVTVIANYREKTYYKLTYEITGADGITKDMEYYQEGDNVILSASDYMTSLADKPFAGWYLDAEHTRRVSSFTITQDTTVYGWYVDEAPFTLTVDFNGHGDKDQITITCDRPDRYSCNELVYSALAGYSTAEEAVSDEFLIPQSLASRGLGGQFELPKATWVDWAGHTETIRHPFYIDDSRVNMPTCPGYILAGWNLHPDYEDWNQYSAEASSLDDGISINTTVYLSWQIELDTVYINLEGGVTCGESIDDVNGRCSVDEQMPYFLVPSPWYDDLDNRQLINWDLDGDEVFLGEDDNHTGRYTGRAELYTDYGYVFAPIVEVYTDNLPMTVAIPISDSMERFGSKIDVELSAIVSHDWGEWEDDEQFVACQIRTCKKCGWTQRRAGTLTGSVTLDMQGIRDDVVIDELPLGESIEFIDTLPEANPSFYETDEWFCYGFLPRPVSDYDSWEALGRARCDMLGNQFDDDDDPEKTPMPIGEDTTLYAIWLRKVRPEVIAEAPLCGTSMEDEDNSPVVSVAEGKPYSLVSAVWKYPYQYHYGGNYSLATIFLKPAFGYWLKQGISVDGGIYEDHRYGNFAEDYARITEYDIDILAEHWQEEGYVGEVGTLREPGCETEGLVGMRIPCGADCGSTVETRVISYIPPKGHYWVLQDYDGYQAPTDTEPGQKIYSCRVCYKTISTTLAPTGGEHYSITISSNGSQYNRTPIVSAQTATAGERITVDPNAGDVRFIEAYETYRTGDGPEDYVRFDIIDTLSFTMPAADVVIYITYNHTVPAPKLPKSTTFEGMKTIELLPPGDVGTVMYYTTDGSDPLTINEWESDTPFTLSDSAILYEGPFEISDTTIIKAVAVYRDWETTYYPNWEVIPDEALDDLPEWDVTDPGAYASAIVTATYTENSWQVLNRRIHTAAPGALFRLDVDVIATPSDGPLEAGSGVNLTIDLAGHTIDRDLAEAVQDGSVMVLHDGASIKLIGGTLTGGCSNGNGGGVLAEEGSSLTLDGVFVTGNNSTGVGGGVYAGGTVTLTGAKITGNTATAGGGVAVDGVLNVSGDMDITTNTNSADKPDNVYLGNGKVVTLAGKLDGTARIGINLEAQHGVFTSGMANHGSLDNFSSDVEGIPIILDAGETGEARLVSLELGEANFILPADIAVIGEEAFMGIDASVVYVPDGTGAGEGADGAGLRIESRAFADCKHLEQIRLPDGVNYIAPDAFEGCGFITIFGGGEVARTFAEGKGYLYVGE